MKLNRTGFRPCLFDRVLLACAGAATVFAASAQVSVSEPGLNPVPTVSVEIESAVAADWGIRETDWQRYQELMRGPAGLHYRHLSPAFVLGLHAETDADRDRWARIVWEEERRRLERLFDFNRAYNRIARAIRQADVFSFFDSQYLEQPAGFSPLHFGTNRPLIFVADDCAECDKQVRELASRRKAFDIYYVGATSDQEISRWARRIALPAAEVVNKRITLNHDRGNLARAGYGSGNLPMLFADADLSRALTIQEALK